MPHFSDNLIKEFLTEEKSTRRIKSIWSGCYVGRGEYEGGVWCYKDTNGKVWDLELPYYDGESYYDLRDDLEKELKRLRRRKDVVDKDDLDITSFDVADRVIVTLDDGTEVVFGDQYEDDEDWDDDEDDKIRTNLFITETDEDWEYLPIDEALDIILKRIRNIKTMEAFNNFDIAWFFYEEDDSGDVVVSIYRADEVESNTAIGVIVQRTICSNNDGAQKAIRQAMIDKYNELLNK